MATERELSNKLSSGEITQMKIGGTATGNIVQTKNDLDIIEAKADGNSTNITDLTNGAFPISVANFKDMTGVSHTHEIGDLLFESGRLKFYDGYLDAPIRIGSSLTAEVYNNTGAIIPKLTAVSYDGLAGGLVSIKPTLITDLNTANVLGVTAHDIQIASSGIVISEGLIEDVDTSAFTIGVALYASDAVAGGIVEIAPDISSQVGVSLVSDALIGEFFVKIRNTINLPTTISSIRGQTNGSYTLVSNTPQAIVDYVSDLSVVDTTNKLAGTLTIKRKGVYFPLFDFTGTLSDEEINMTFDLYDVTNAIVLDEFKFTSGRGSSATLVPIDKTFSRPVDILADNTEVIMRVTSATNETLVINDCSFTFTSLHVR